MPTARSKVLQPDLRNRHCLPVRLLFRVGIREQAFFRTSSSIGPAGGFGCENAGDWKAKDEMVRKCFAAPNSGLRIFRTRHGSSGTRFLLRRIDIEVLDFPNCARSCPADEPQWEWSCCFSSKPTGAPVMAAAWSLPRRRSLCRRHFAIGIDRSSLGRCRRPIISHEAMP